MKHYSKKLGKIKYWILVTIPLAYFLSQFQPLFLFTFDEFRLSDPVLFGIVYTLLFSISKPLGGVLFGVAFWIVARNLKDSKVKGYLIISAYGMTLLFASNQPSALLLVPYPPFGLVTVCFMGLASYLLYLGIYSSALSVSEDSRLHRTIRKAALEESQQFLDAIGSAEMEQEIQKKVLRFSKKTKALMEYETGISTSIDDEDIKRYLDEVLIELKGKKNNHN
ncbi:MAG: Yip1 family protein, partial [Nitrososphaeraceae archaeon]